MTEQRTSPGFLGTQVKRGREGVQMAMHRLRLSVETGVDRGLEHEVSGTRVRIGSAEDSDLRLSDPTVSRHHCEIRVGRRGYTLRDLGSRNGTVVGATLVREAVLLPGATFQVGGNVIAFQPRRRWESVPPTDAPRFGDLWGETTAMRSLFSLLERLAPTDLSVLFVGETGTGKELAARALHAASARGDRPFVVFDCAATTPTLVEAELFGQERGAFTGAHERRAGVFEQADGGSLFLDEVGELPAELQPKLLRALDRGEVRRLGGDRLLRVDVRVVAATHRDLVTDTLREDLFYRLAEAMVELPPLRTRVSDVPVLAQRFLEAGAGGQPRRLGPDAVQWLMEQPWPGNVRQLRNVVRRAAAFAEGEALGAADLAGALASARPSETTADVDLTTLPLREAREQWLAPMERHYLERLLERSEGDMDRASAESGMHRKSLLRLLRRHGLRDD